MTGRKDAHCDTRGTTNKEARTGTIGPQSANHAFNESPQATSSKGAHGSISEGGEADCDSGAGMQKESEAAQEAKRVNTLNT